MAGRWYALPSTGVRRLLFAVILGAMATTACGGHSTTKADQGRSIAEQAGLAPEVASFFALAASGATATYRSTVQTTESNGNPLQVTTTERPPDSRFDAFHADGTIDSTIAVGGHSYQCTMAANHWDCGELGVAGSTTGQVFSPSVVQGAIDKFRERASDYDFRVEDRQLVGVKARCLITTRKPGHDQDSSLGATATLCLSPEGAILLVETPSGSLTATSYSTTIPDDAFKLPAAVSPPSTAGSSASSASSSPPPLTAN
jgi:hypothetical protein